MVLCSGGASVAELLHLRSILRQSLILTSIKIHSSITSWIALPSEIVACSYFEIVAWAYSEGVIVRAAHIVGSATHIII